ncbi:MAG: hypothetical protein ACM3II_19090 [Rhodospirillaceae bacterium]
MTDQGTTTANEAQDSGARQRAIEAYDSVRDGASDALGQAPLLALAGGLAAGALIAALLPRTDAETRLVRPTAKRVRKTASAAFDAGRDTGSQRLDEMGLNRQKGEQTIRKLLDDLTDIAKDSANAALKAARKANDG